MANEQTGSGARVRDIKITQQQLVFFNRQLASMARLNMPIAKGLRIMAEEVADENFRELILGVQRDLEEGVSLDEALAKYPSSFNKIYLELLRAGESTGNLSLILSELTKYSETMYSVRARLRDALSYPVVVGGMLLLFLLYFFIFAVPKFRIAFVQLARTQESDLPGSTRAVFWISDLILTPWLSIPLFLLCLAGLGYLGYRFAKGWERYDQFMFRIPLFGQLFKKATLLKLNRTLRDLLANGVSLVTALGLTSRILGENEYRDHIEAVRGKVEEGQPFAENLAKGSVFPETMVWKLQMGEEKGVIEEALDELSLEYEEDIESTTKYIMRVVGPIFLLIICAAVGLLFASFYPPMLKIMSQVR